MSRTLWLVQHSYGASLVYATDADEASEITDAIGTVEAVYPFDISMAFDIERNRDSEDEGGALYLQVEANHTWDFNEEFEALLTKHRVPVIGADTDIDAALHEIEARVASTAAVRVITAHGPPHCNGCGRAAVPTEWVTQEENHDEYVLTAWRELGPLFAVCPGCLASPWAVEIAKAWASR